MYNGKVNQTVFNKVAKRQIPVDPAGYWNSDNWGKPVIIPSNTVTGMGINQPLIGIDNLGTVKPIFPGQRLIKFPGDIVTEFPIIPKKQVDPGWGVSPTRTGKPIPWPMTDSGRPSASYYNRMRGLPPGLFMNGGIMELELTDAEIQDYINQGYVVEELPKAQMGVIGKQASNQGKDDVGLLLGYRAGDSYPTAGVRYIKGLPTTDPRLQHSFGAGIYGSPEKIGTDLIYSSKYGEPNKPFNTLFDIYGGYGTDQGFYTGVGAYPMFNIVDRKDASFSAGPYLGYEMQTKLPQGIVNTMQSTGDVYFADPQSLPLGLRLPLSSGFRYGVGAQGNIGNFYGKGKFWFDPIQGKLSDPDSNNPIIKTYQEKVGTESVHLKPSVEVSIGYNFPVDNSKKKIRAQIEKRKDNDRLEKELDAIKNLNQVSEDPEKVDFVKQQDLKKKMLESPQKETRYRFQEGGESFELELTDEEIEQYRKGGYIVEELPKAQKGIADPSKMKRRMSLLDKYNTDPALSIPKPEVSESTKPTQTLNKTQKKDLKSAPAQTQQAIETGRQMIANSPSLSNEQKYEMVTDPQKSLDYYNTVATFEDNQGTIKKKIEQTALDRLMDYGVHLGDAGYYWATGEDMPSNYIAMRRAGIDPIEGGNLIFRGVNNMINPAYALETSNNAYQQGNYGEALLSLAGIVPLARATDYFSDAQKLLTGKTSVPKVVKSKPSAWDNVYIPPEQAGFNPLKKFFSSPSTQADEVAEQFLRQDPIYHVDDFPNIKKHKGVDDAIENLQMQYNVDRATAEKYLELELKRPANQNIKPRPQATDAKKDLIIKNAVEKDDSNTIRQFLSEESDLTPVGFEDVGNKLEAMAARGKYWDNAGVKGKDVLNENTVEYLGTNDGRPIVQVTLPDGTKQSFYKSSGWGGKEGIDKAGTTEGQWIPFPGFSNNPTIKGLRDKQEWFIKDNNVYVPGLTYKDYYGSNVFKDMALDMDNVLMKKYNLKSSEDVNKAFNFQNREGNVDSYVINKQSVPMKTPSKNINEIPSSWQGSPEGFREQMENVKFYKGSNKLGGSIEAELTPEQIQWYLDNGYNVDYM